MGDSGVNDYQETWLSYAPGSHPGWNSTGGDVLNVTVDVGYGVDGCAAGDGMEDMELFEGYNSTLLHLASACCIVFILVGIPGNLITIVALFRCKKMACCVFSAPPNIAPASDMVPGDIREMIQSFPKRRRTFSSRGIKKEEYHVRPGKEMYLISTPAPILLNQNKQKDRYITVKPAI